MSLFDTALLVSTVGLTTPILLAALGELVAERSGVINIGLEGMMLVGAFFGFWGAHMSGSLVVGVVVAAVAGLLLSAIMAAVSIGARGNQIVVGIGINILAAGIVTFANAEFFSSESQQPQIDPMGSFAIPGLSHLPIVGNAFFDLVPLADFAYLMVPVLAWVLYRTNVGLATRGAGEDPEAIRVTGRNVRALRAGGTLFAGAMAGLGGAMLTVGSVGVFNVGASGGRGFIALAAVILGRWKPGGVLLACLVFGGAEAIQLRLQAYPAIPVGVWVIGVAVVLAGLVYSFHNRQAIKLLSPSAIVSLALIAFGIFGIVAAPSWTLPAQFWLMFPYIVALAVLAGFVGRTRAPAALGSTV